MRPAAGQGTQGPVDLVDLADPGQEHQRGLLLPVDRVQRLPGQMAEEGRLHPAGAQPGSGGRGVAHGERVDGCLELEHRGVEEPGEVRGVEGGGHGDDAQVIAQLAELGEHAEEEIGVELALMDLIEDDRADPGQLRIGQQLAHEHTRGEELHPRTPVVFAAHAEPDRATEGAAVEFRQSTRGRADGHPPRGGDQHPTRAGERLGHRGRDHRCFTGTGRGLDDEVAGRGIESGAQLREQGGGGQARPDAVEVEVVSSGGHGGDKSTSGAPARAAPRGRPRGLPPAAARAPAASHRGCAPPAPDCPRRWSPRADPG